MDSSKQSTNNPINRKQLRTSKRAGIYLGEVMATTDITKTGTLTVFIASLAKNKEDKNGYFECIWSSPFAGGTNYAAIQVNDTKSFIGTQKSYGMWMVPPDKGNIVLVAFGDGNMKYPFIISCLYPHRANHMIPGIPGSVRNYGALGNNLPVAEKNKFDPMPEDGTDILRPVHDDLAETITKQGLINDTIRGASSSGAKRESPSEVFGILTPGPKDAKNDGHRHTGHQFIMDDNLNSRNIRLRTGGGNQLLLDDTTGTVYIINKSGRAWVELGADGSINLYGERSFNVRTKGDFNLRADKDIKIEAGGDVKIKAAGDTLGDKNVGIPKKGIPLPGGPLGYGGHIRLESVGEFTAHAGTGTKLTSKDGDFDINAAGMIRQSGLKYDLDVGVGGISVGTQGQMYMSSLLGATFKSEVATAVQGLTVLLNSGPGAAPIIPVKAQTAPELEVQTHVDQPKDQPEYDRDSEQKLPENGERPGGPTELDSLVGVLVTAEPWDGHDMPDLMTHSSEGMVEDTEADIDPATQPVADANSPEGYKQAIEASLLTIEKSKAASKAKDLAKGVSGISDKLGGITDKISGLGDKFGGPLKDKLSNFNIPGMKYLQSLQGFSNYSDMLTKLLPPLRFPTTNAFAQKIIGQSKILTELEARFSAMGFGFDGLPLEFQDLENIASGKLNALSELKGKVDGAIGGVFAKAGLPGGGLKDLSNLSNTLQNEVSVDTLQNIVKDAKKGIG